MKQYFNNLLTTFNILQVDKKFFIEWIIAFFGIISNLVLKYTNDIDYSILFIVKINVKLKNIK